MNTPSAADRVDELARKFQERFKSYEAKSDERTVCCKAFYLLHCGLRDHLADEDFPWEDRDWVADLAENFAQIFYDAMDGIDGYIADRNKSEIDRDELREAAGSRPWADVYGAICLEKSYVLECLLVPLLAHMGYDLPIALVKTGLTSNGTSRINDYHRINEVLGASIDEVQTRLAKRYRGFLQNFDKIGGRKDEQLTDLGMRIWRAWAWYSALRIEESTSREETLASLERMADQFIQQVRKPKRPIARVTIWVLRVVMPTRKRMKQKDFQELT